MSYLPAFQVPEIVSQHVATTTRAAALQRRLYTQQPMARGDCSDDCRCCVFAFFSSSLLLFFFLSADEYTHSGEVSAIYTFSAE